MKKETYQQRLLKDWLKLQITFIDDIQIDTSEYYNDKNEFIKNPTMKDFESIHNHLMKMGDDINDLTMDFNRFRRKFEKHLN